MSEWIAISRAGLKTTLDDFSPLVSKLLCAQVGDSCNTRLSVTGVVYFQVVRMGSVAGMKDLSGEKRRVVVARSSPDKDSITVFDVKSRKRKTVTC